MSIKVTRGLAPEWFQPASQKNSPTPAEFHVRPLSQIELLDIEGLASAEMNGRAAERALRYALRDWRGVYDGDAELAFSPAAAVNLPASIIVEIVARVLAISRLSEGERKN